MCILRTTIHACGHFSFPDEPDFVDYSYNRQKLLDARSFRSAHNHHHHHYHPQCRGGGTGGYALGEAEGPEHAHFDRPCAKVVAVYTRSSHLCKDCTEYAEDATTRESKRRNRLTPETKEKERKGSRDGKETQKNNDRYVQERGEIIHTDTDYEMSLEEEGDKDWVSNKDVEMAIAIGAARDLELERERYMEELDERYAASQRLGVYEEGEGRWFNEGEYHKKKGTSRGKGKGNVLER